MDDESRDVRRSADVDARIFDGASRDIGAAVEAYVSYVERKFAEGVPLNAMTRHMLGLFNGRPGARLFRRYLSEHATRPGAGIDTLRAALAHVSPRLSGEDRSMHAAA